MQSEKTCWSKQHWVWNRCGCLQKVIITILVFCVVFPCGAFSLSFFGGGIIFHGMKSQLRKTQIGLLHTETRANGRTEAEGRERGKWNNIICAVMVIICCRNKWLRPAEKGWWLSRTQRGNTASLQGAKWKETSRVHPVSCFVIQTFWFFAHSRSHYLE